MISVFVKRFRSWKAQRDSMKVASVMPEKDELGWNEKIPLALALIAQSYVIFNWYLASVKGIGDEVDFVVAITAGIALDLIVVTTTMGRREGRESDWSHFAAFGAFVCSALIALKVYGAVGWLPEGWLHIAFPLEVWLYSQHLATPKRARQGQEAKAIVETPLTTPALPSPTPELTLDELLTRMGKTRQEMLAILGRFGMMDTKAEFVYARLKQYGALPDGVSETRFGVLLGELKQDAAPIAKTQQRPSGASQKRASNGITKRSRIRSALDEHGDLKDSMLYEMFPDISQSGVRNTAKEWRDEKKATMNGHS